MENENDILLKDSILNFHPFDFFKDLNNQKIENTFSNHEKISNISSRSTDSDEKIKENNNNNNNNNLFEYYLYNKENKKFAFFTKNNFIIFTNKNGKIILSYYFNNFNKFIYFSIDSNNQFCLLVDDKNKAYLINLKNKYNSLISIEGHSNNFLGGFFVENIDNKILLFIINKHFVALINIKMNKKEKFHKIFYNKMSIDEFYFNLKYYILILRSDSKNFNIINFKNNNCIHKILKKILYENIVLSKLVLQNIYNKLYLLKIDSNNLVFFKMNNLELMNLGKEIPIPKDQNEVIDIENINIQFNNNLIYLYINQKIYIIDLKSKNNYIIAIIKTNFNQNLKIYENKILFNNKFYKVKFNLNNFYYNNNLFIEKDSFQKEIDLFFLIIRRKNSNDLCLNMLKNLLKDFKIQNMISIFNKILEKKSKLTNLNNESYFSNENIVYKRKENFFYFDENNFFFLFQNISSIKIEKLFQIFLYLIHLYKIYHIKLNEDNYMYTLIYLIGKLENYSYFDLILNQNVLKFKEQIGFILIEKSKSIKEKKQNFLAFNLGLKIIIKNNENYKNVFKELLEKKLFNEALNFLENIFYEKKKFFLSKNYVNYNCLKKFIFDKLVELSQNNIKLQFLYE